MTPTTMIGLWYVIGVFSVAAMIVYVHNGKMKVSDVFLSLGGGILGPVMTAIVLIMIYADHHANPVLDLNKFTWFPKFWVR